MNRRTAELAAQWVAARPHVDMSLEYNVDELADYLRWRRPTLRRRAARFLETAGFWAALITVCAAGLSAAIVALKLWGSGCW